MTRKFTPNHDDPGTVEGGEVLFKLDDWEIHAMIETPEIAEAFHHCDGRDRNRDYIAYSYQISGDPQCPGCDAIQPDEIQGLVAMYNADKPTQPKWADALSRHMHETWKREWKALTAERKGIMFK